MKSAILPTFFERFCQGALPLLALPTIFFAASHPAAASGPSYLPRVLASSHAVSAVNATQVLPLTLTLPLRNPAEAKALISRISNPKDALYGKYLTTQEFIDRFSPTEAQYEAVASYYASLGYQITGRSANRLILKVAAPASTVENTFRVNLGYYRQPNGKLFYSGDREPQIPAVAGVSNIGVIGLDNALQLHTHHKKVTPLAQAIAGPSYLGTGAGGGLTPTDIKKAYNLTGVTQTGTGQSLALMELDGYDPQDIADYEYVFNLPAVPLQNILVDSPSGVGSGTDGQFEVTLDIELQIALAPKIDKIYVYEAPNTGQGLVDIYNQIAVDNKAKSISTSWGLYETGAGSAVLLAEEQSFQQMALQGQTLFAAAGDSGAYDDAATLSVDDPASDPYVTGVGGTSITLNADQTYGSETTWGDPTDHSRSSFGGGGGGGLSAYWPQPDYQAALGLGDTMRAVPDVSLDADPNTGYSLVYQGYYYIGGGTSCAAPLWSAFAALVNQQRVSTGLSTLGLVQPLLYSIAGNSSVYASTFHDIADNSTNLYWPAISGYDKATGLGSFNGANLLSTLTTPASTGPTGLIATAGYQTASLSWNAIDTADYYTVKRSTKSGGPYAFQQKAYVSSADDTSLKNGVTYYYVVSATINGVESGNSAEAAVTPHDNTTPVIVSGGLSINPSTVIAGTRTTGTITLSTAAPAGGATITLSSSDPTVAVVYSSIPVPAGATTVTFPVATRTVSASSTATINASLNGGTQSATVTVFPAITPSALTIAPGSVTGGVRSTGTLTISGPAPTGGLFVPLSSSDTNSAAVYTGVLVPAGATSATFPIITKTVTSAKTVTISAAVNGGAKTATVIVSPAAIPASVTINPSKVTMGTQTTGTVTLSTAAPTGGLFVRLASNDPSALVYTGVTVPEGATSATFPVITKTVASQKTATITATLNGTSASATVTVALPLTVTGLTIAQSPIKGGTRTTGTVTLSGAALSGGVTVSLASSNTSAAVVYSTVTIPAGAASATFPIAGLSVSASATATITATANGTSQTAPITVTP